jgi:glucokinase
MKAIVDTALDTRIPSDLCRATIEVVVSVLAGETGRLAFRVLATGGLNLAGGLVLHLLEALREPRLMQVFARKGRFEELMKQIFIRVIATCAALCGAVTYGAKSLADQKE